MKAKLIQQEAPGGKRTALKDVLPLETPFVIQVFPIYACNFLCKYCHFAVPQSERGFVTDRISMDIDLYKKIIDEIREFPEKIKTLRFVGMGEPLLHKDIALMVKYAKEKNIADRIELLTNGSLLTNAMSDSLIDAGLDRLVISLQGTSQYKYQETSGIELNFQQFLDNIKYFYNFKKNTHVYCKVVDCALDGEDDKKRFFDLFGDICDSIGIEYVVPIFPRVPYNEQLEERIKHADKNVRVTQFGLQVDYVNICPQSFYSIQINPDGKVVGCYSISYPAILGDCTHTKIKDIWDGKPYNNFRLKMLNGREMVCDICKDCNIMNNRFFPEDDIRPVAETLKKHYEDDRKRD